MNAAAPPELHLPDLPEVEVTLAPPALWRDRRSWRRRLRDLLSAYLPLLLMTLLALSTWWLVKNTPRPPADNEPIAMRSDPDYEMRDFAITRFAADGHVKVRVEGQLLRHYPDTDRLEIVQADIRAIGADGRTTHARAARALGNGDGSEWQLSGGAKVTTQPPSGSALEIDSEFLQVYVSTERLRTHLPVVVRRGSDELRAAAMSYDNLAQRLELSGPVRASFGRPGAPGASRGSP
ncbi:MAG: LPS export ABC transporter periplasmic protein LptC [Burkholderiaceae bacterium]